MPLLVSLVVPGGCSVLRRALALAILSLLLLLPTTEAQQLCYYPNGQQSTDVPCNASAAVSMCCQSQRACLSNGLCALAGTGPDAGNSYARGTCTDRSWTNGLCPQRCILNQDTLSADSSYDFRAGGVNVWGCGKPGFAADSSYCCESAAERSRCCSTPTALFRLPSATVGNAVGQTFVTAPPSSVPPAAAASSNPPGRPSSPPPGPGLDQGAKIGIGVGVGLGLGLPLAVVAFVLVRRRLETRDEAAAAAAGAMLSPPKTHDDVMADPYGGGDAARDSGFCYAQGDDSPYRPVYVENVDGVAVLSDVRSSRSR